MTNTGFFETCISRSLLTHQQGKTQNICPSCKCWMVSYELWECWPHLLSEMRLAW